MIAKLVAVIVGFTVGVAAMIGLAVALDNSQAGTQTPAAAPVAMNAMNGTNAMMAAATSNVAPTGLVIQHVEKGCHVWSNGSHQAVSMHMALKPGGQLRILDQDVDPHQLVQLAGPTLALRGHMMMNQKQLITFKQPGLYRFKTKVVEMGPMMDVKTIGPDNTLRLTVSVRS